MGGTQVTNRTGHYPEELAKIIMKGVRMLCDSKEVLNADEELEYWSDVDHEELDDRGIVDFPATEKTDEPGNPKAMKISKEFTRTFDIHHGINWFERFELAELAMRPSRRRMNN
eukprot:9302846-Pyramimonas_sp.AAC.1